MIISTEKQNLFERIYIMFFAAVNGLLIAVPGIYSEEFGTFLDLFYFVQEKGYNYYASALIIASLFLLLTSVLLIISISFKIRQQKELVWEWYIYFFNILALASIGVFSGDYFVAIGLNSLGEKVVVIFVLIFAIQLFSFLALQAFAYIGVLKGKREIVSGFVPLEEAIKLNVGERELYKIHVSKPFGYAGVLMLSSERILFSGKNIFTYKSIAISIPFEKNN